MENKIEVRADNGLRPSTWSTDAAVVQAPQPDPFDTALAGHSQANPFNDQEGDFSQDLFDGIVQRFGEESSTRASPGGRALTRDSSAGTHAASSKTETSSSQDPLARCGEKIDQGAHSAESTIDTRRQDMVAFGERHSCAVGRDLSSQYCDSETKLHNNYNRYYDPSHGRYLRSDPLGRGVWRCKRPLNGQPTEHAPSVFNHAFVCAKDENGQMYCGSTTPIDNSSWSKKLLGTESRPTTGDDGDYYVESACEEVDELDEKDPLCVERCVIGELQSDWRPTFSVGPRGTDCQEWTDDILDTCTTICSKSWNDDRLDYLRENPKPPARYR